MTRKQFFMPFLGIITFGLVKPETAMKVPTEYVPEFLEFSNMVTELKPPVALQGTLIPACLILTHDYQVRIFNDEGSWHDAYIHDVKRMDYFIVFCPAIMAVANYYVASGDAIPWTNSETWQIPI